MAGLLGLNAAKYQYAVDQYQREHEVSFLKLSTVLVKVKNKARKGIFCLMFLERLF